MVTVEVADISSGVVSLQVSARLGDQPGTPALQSVTYPLDNFLVTLPADKSGDLGLVVTGLNGDGCFVAQGRASGYISGPGSYFAAVALAGGPVGCPVPSGTTNDLVRVWGSGPSDVWAVGLEGTVLHWDGAAWAGVPSGITNSLYAVWGSGPSDVWAVGESVLHWDGLAWTSASAGIPDHRPPLIGVWGRGPQDVWAVGDIDSRGGFRHWNGSVWSVAAILGPSVKSVWENRPNDIWAVGFNNTELHWDGSVWNSVSDKDSESFILAGVWGSGPSDMWAVGGAGYSGLDGSIILRWNGSAWSTVASGSALGDLAGVWGSGSSDIWVVGASGKTIHFRP